MYIYIYIYSHLDSHEIGVITCTSMLGFLFTTKYKKEVEMEELETSFEWLAQEIIDAKRYITKLVYFFYLAFVHYILFHKTSAVVNYFDLSIVLCFQ